MARLGTKRVDDVLDYEQDIKGMGLVRLRAGVGAGKNYWVRNLPKKYPSLQILMITSRKNVAAGEAYKLDIDNKIHISSLIDKDDRAWLDDIPGNVVIVTNAYIENFFKNIYDKENLSTHLWNKFDVIFVDEAHSLTADATFANSSFYVAQFVRHCRRLNPKCDVVMMSGTQEPIDWMFTEEYGLGEYVNIDLYEECVHLVPNKVFMMSADDVAERVYNIWSRGHRLVYFVNSVTSMADLIEKLLDLGIPEADMGIAYTSSDNENRLPPNLVSNRNELRNYIVNENYLPRNIKLFITTTQNKEGINIKDDDIKYMFSESHNKAELEQMAGRVRGNDDSGEGLRNLIVVYDAKEHWSEKSFLECEFDRRLVLYGKEVMQLHKQVYEEHDKEYKEQKDIAAIHKKHRYMRYDYVAERFEFFAAREKAEQQIAADQEELKYFMSIFDEPLGYRSYKDGSYRLCFGRTELQELWFPYSKVFHSPGREMSPQEEATNELLAFLQDHNFLDVAINREQQGRVLAEIHRLIDVYGASTLGFGRTLPVTLKPALGRFNLTLEDTPSHHNTDKIIRLMVEVVEQGIGADDVL